MPDYATQIPVRDRWLIVAYLRTLQLSQHAAVDDVPADRRAELDATPETTQSTSPASAAPGNTGAATAGKPASAAPGNTGAATAGKPAEKH